MSERNFDFLSNSEYEDLINNFESYLRHGYPSYFDVNELEFLLDYHLDLDKTEAVLTLLKLSDKLHPGTVGIKFRKAKYLFSTGNLDEAWELLEEVESLEKSNAEVYLIKGMIHVMNKKFKAAKKMFEKAVDMAGDELEDMYYTIATTLETATQYKSAIAYFKAAYKLSGGAEPELLYDLAYCYEKSGNYEKSTDYYKKYLDRNPFSESAWYNLAVNYHNKEKYQQAQDAFEYALTVKPAYLPAVLGSAENLMQLQDYKQAIVYFKKYIELAEPEADIIAETGEAYYKLEESKTAQQYYLSALDKNSRCSEAHHGLGLLKYDEGKYLESITHIKTALKHTAYNPDYWYSLAISCQKINFATEAEKAFKKALDLYPYNPEIWVNYADLAFSTGNVKHAIKLLTEGDSFNENTARIKYRLAAYHLEVKDKKNAISYFSEALRLNADESNDFFSFYPKAVHFTELRSLLKNKQ
ncbi:MAG: tetratricopeptide repeat protein [Candidatus Delongbacteria bacterium]|jgi:tetratricopeptide (TPR) repeat protein|nr:tetratricopeptide repeat protein [Candidatus Delongbacteria bacterium]